MEVDEEVKPRLIKKEVFFNFNHYNYGEAFFGSYKGMRYRLARNPLKNVIFIPVADRGEATFDASIWPEPRSYAETPAEAIETRSFPFTEEGFEEAIDWFNEQYVTRKDYWCERRSILDT
ncbi:hypothetical protein [Butyrivibrio sp. MC2013]|uniref:hypothetical protein n=1 Tax=Butyrivibrio sp. MC2013 TaxID=1280686 RepID=UPI00040BAC0A|nr:hypothetical protein [Butyrivibrio sp. MC2013]